MKTKRPIKPVTLKRRRTAGSLERVVSRRKTSPDVARDIMFLFGVEYVHQRKFNKAVNLIRAIWRDGWECGVAVEKSRPKLFRDIKRILRGKDKAANDPSSETRPT